MAGMDQHLILEARLQSLAARIAELQQRLTETEGIGRLEEFAEIGELQSRYERLADRLHKLEPDTLELWQGEAAKWEMEAIADDLTTVEDFMMDLESDYRPRPKPAPEA